MMHKFPMMHIKLKYLPVLIGLLSMALHINPAYTNPVTEVPHQEEDVDLNPYSISAIPRLTSLKNLRNIQEYRAPFVRDIANSLKVRTLFVESHDLPIVDIQITFDAGSARDESLGLGMFGMSNMAAKLMIEGTEQLDAKQITSTFDGLGAKYAVHAYRDMFTIRLRVLSDPQKMQPALDLLLDLIKNATFKQSGINLVLSNTQVGQKQIQENPSRLMNIQFYRALYGQHPYAQPTSGTNGGIRKVTPDILKQFRDTFLVAQNANIAITGDLSQEQAQQLSELISTRLPQGNKAAPIPEPQSKDGLDLHYIRRNSEQASVMMGHLGVQRDHPDRIALEVANRIFGGNSFTSLLSKELRIKRGLTYSASSSISSTRAAGVFSFSYATRKERLLDSIQIAHQTLIDFYQKPISALTLQETKESILRAFPMTLTSNASINAHLAAMGFYGLPSDYLSHYQKQISQLTSAQIQKAIRNHLHPERLTIVVVSEDLDKPAVYNILNDNLIQAGLKSKPAAQVNPDKINSAIHEQWKH